MAVIAASEPVLWVTLRVDQSKCGASAILATRVAPSGSESDGMFARTETSDERVIRW